MMRLGAWLTANDPKRIAGSCSQSIVHLAWLLPMLLAIAGRPAQAAPTITGFSPPSGVVGTTVQITGTNFSTTPANDIVTFNTTTAVVTAATTTLITTTVPSGATTGKIKVKVGTQTATSANNFTVLFAPTISSFSPPSGPVGTSVTINGTHYSTTLTDNQVTFDGVAASVTSATSTRLKATVPHDALTGPIQVTVAGLSATSSTDYSVPSPTISGFFDTSGFEGDEIEIDGANFSTVVDDDLVTFSGGAVASIVDASDPSRLLVIVPTGAQSGPITVGVGIQTVTSSDSFTVLHAPTITGFSPPSGLAGTSVTITGTYFDPTVINDAVYFHGNGNFVQATVTSASASQLIVTVPTLAATGTILVSVNGAQATSSDSFTVPTTPPVITSFDPPSGSVGTSVNIVGQNFTPNASFDVVTFNGTPAVVSAATATQLTVTVPSGATTGPIQVTVGTLSGVSGSNFTVTPPIMAIAFEPAGGPVGIAVAITTTNYDFDTSSYSVKFNGIPDPSPSMRLVTIDGVIMAIFSAKVPSGATTGPITITTDSNSGTSEANFVVTPTITGFIPGTGSAGTPVTITGTNFGSTPASNAVTFNGTAASVTTASETQLGVVVPTGATSGRIQLTTGGQHATSSASFSVVQTAPTITGFSPTSGAHGAAVTISGTNFSATPTTDGVTFNGVAATVSAATSTQLSVTVPSLAVTGPISVSIGNQSATSTNSFVVTDVPAIQTSYVYDARGQLSAVTSNGGDARQFSYDALGNIVSVEAFTSGQLAIFGVSPNEGAIGDVITINGQGFDANTTADALEFNGVPASVDVATSTQITARVPASATTGPVSLTVGGETATSSNPFLVTTGLNPSVPTGVQIPAGGTIEYTFNASTGDHVGISLSNVSTSPAGLTVSITINNPDGSQVTTTSTSSSVFLNVPTLLQTGTYAISLHATGASNATADLTLVPTSYSLAIDAIPQEIGMAYAGERIYLSFVGDVGQSLSLVMADLSSSPTPGYSVGYEISNPGGGILTNGECHPPGCHVALNDLASAGTYSVVLNLEGQNSNFTATVRSDVTGTLTSNIAEPLNLAAGRIAKLSFSGMAGDYWGLYLTNFATQPPGGAAHISIYDPDGTYFVAASAGFTNLPILPQTGTYLAYVESDNADASTGELTLIPTSESLSVDSPPLPVSSYPGERVFLIFNGTAGQNLNFIATGFQTNPPGNTAFYTIYAPGASTYFASGTCEPPGCHHAMTNLSATGTYVIELDPDSDVTSSMALDAAVVTVTAADLVPGVPSEASLDQPGKVALLTFAGNEGEGWGVQFSGVTASPASDSVSYSVYNPDFTILVDDSVASYQFANLPLLPQTGTYTILVEPQNLDTASAQLTLFSMPPYVLDANGGTVSVPTTQPDQMVRFDFSGVAQQDLTFTINNLNVAPTGLNLFLEVDDVHGNEVTAANCGSPGCSMPISNLPATGNYQIKVSPAEALGSMSFDGSLTSP